MTDTPTEFDEILRAEPVSIKLLKIPAGSFLMGSPPESNSNYEKPQHLVTLESFWLSQTPITQAQWSIVANWPTVNVLLKPNPSYFKGPNKPVEQVSWEDAIEFCNRLCQHTGRYYSLPSEAQWEYACRAGTTTPFHFGETISSELANYNGNYTYGKGQEGVYRKQTTDAGSFPANAWGLQDMHGNVWEWCADHWHGNYKEAPTDGSPWTNDTNYVGTRLLRGGSWLSSSRDCRSAARLWWPQDFRHINVGFRLCGFPQDDEKKDLSDGQLRERTTRNFAGDTVEIAKLTGDATAAQPFIEQRKVVVPWLLEFAVQAANNGFPRAAGKLTLAAQLLGERLDSE